MLTLVCFYPDAWLILVYSNYLPTLEFAVREVRSLVLYKEDKNKSLYHHQSSLLRFPFIRHRCFQWHMTRTSKIRHNCSLIMTKQTCQLTITVPYRSRLPSRSYLF